MKIESKINAIYTIVIAAKRRDVNDVRENAWNLTSIGGRPLLVTAIKSKTINFNNLAIGILSSEDLIFGTSGILSSHFSNARIVSVPDNLPGALITTLLTVQPVPYDSPIIITTGDSTQNHSMIEIVEQFLLSDCDAGVVCFKSKDPRYSYLKEGISGEVTQVAEKVVIGELATSGTYFFKNVEIFMDAAKWCLVNNIRTNDQFFVSSSLNYMIHRGMKIDHFEIDTKSYIPMSSLQDLQTIRNRLGR